MTSEKQLAAARKGGQTSVARRRERIRRIEEFRRHLVGDSTDPALAAIADAATALFVALLPKATLNLVPKYRTKAADILAISAASGQLRTLLGTLGVLADAQTGTGLNSDPPPDRYAPQALKDAWMSRYLARVHAEVEAREAANKKEQTT